MRTILFAALAGLSAAAMVGPAHAQRGPAFVEVDAISMLDVAETQPLIARLVAMDESTVATRIPGIVGEVMVNVGDRVEAGAALATLDTELLRIELQSAEATLTQIRAGLQVAEANEALANQIFERTQRLEGSAAFSQGRADDLAKELARATAELAQAQAALSVANAGVGSARYRLDNAVITAPFSGVVLSRAADVGDYVQAGGPVATVMDDERLEIEADTPTEIISAMRPGTEVSVRMDDGAPGQARVRALVPVESLATRTRPVRLTLLASETDKPRAAGQSVTVLAPIGPPRQTLTVAKDALVQQVGGWIVYKAENGQAMPIQVRLGTAVDGRYEVRGNLVPGDLVVVRGNERLRPGQPIEFRTPAASPAPPAAVEGDAIETGSADAPGVRADASGAATPSVERADASRSTQ
ncbi:MAG: efflux RND transporter periplasmic adaptor subunit [Pseudomonadota bacterium]